MDSSCGADVVQFLTQCDLQALRCVCRRWYFTCSWLQTTYSDSSSSSSDAQPRKVAWNLQSRHFRHVWHSFVRRECDRLVPHVLRHLPHVSKLDTYALKQGLCESTNTGVRPSFENAHARSGYIAAKMNRCGNLPTLLLTAELASLRSQLFRVGRKQWTVALYGGGPGFDAAGLVLLRTFLRATDDIRFHTNVYDNEPGWATAVTAMQQSLDELHGSCTNRRSHDSACANTSSSDSSSEDSSSSTLHSEANSTWCFKGCDITVAVSDPVNAAMQRDVATTQLFVFSFVCVENFQLLQQSAFGFLQSLFVSAQLESAFVFMDSTHRLWPLIYDVAASVPSAHFRVTTPHARGCHYALVLQKQSLQQHQYERARRDHDSIEAQYFEQAMAKLALFRQHQSEQWKQQ